MSPCHHYNIMIGQLIIFIVKAGTSKDLRLVTTGHSSHLLFIAITIINHHHH